MTNIERNLDMVRQRIGDAAVTAGRDAETVCLVAVSKTHPVELIREVYDAGQRVFGENRVQEAKAKIGALPTDICWHLIGHLQTNKAKDAVKLFSYVESVDRIRVVQELEKRAAILDRQIDILVEVNVGGELSKSGCNPVAVRQVLEAVAGAPHLHARGLMTIPPFVSPEEVRPYFRRLRELRDEAIGWELAGVDLTELSMGMSHDYAVAVEEGATIVRVGTAIFGRRNDG